MYTIADLPFNCDRDTIICNMPVKPLLFFECIVFILTIHLMQCTGAYFIYQVDVWIYIYALYYSDLVLKTIQRRKTF